jgi:hypothetical protein
MIIPFPFAAGSPHTGLFILAAPRAEAPHGDASLTLGPAPRRYPPSAESRLPMDGPLRALASPFAHALNVFLGAVAVAVTVAKSGREEIPSLPTLSHSAEMPSSRAASEILYVVRLFSPMPPR